MARALGRYRIADGLEVQRAASSRRLDRNAAMAFGAAIASLLVATVVVNQSSGALEPQGSIAGTSFEVGTITLSDDDGGRSLVDLGNMVPGDPAEQCIEVAYEGTLLPVEMSLITTAGGPLAPFVMVEIERGTGGGYERCGSIEATTTLYRGPLDELAAGAPLAVGVIRNTGERSSFRLRFELADEAGAMGQATTVDFRWEAVPT